MKIYTKKGDKGETSLFGGQKVSKNSKRIASYGTIDELNSILGLARAFEISSKGDELLSEIQEQLFILGSDLATPFAKSTRIDRIGEKEVQFLEDQIDQLETHLKPLKHFILPGGSKPASFLHFARTVCRRAERIAVDCSKEEEISAIAIQYINRLSDFLFVLARFENSSFGTSDHEWIPVK